MSKIDNVNIVDDEYGRFIGCVRAEWQADGREMRLLDDFAYVDPSGVDWTAPRDAYIDGASIPAFLWDTVGSPYIGKYRNASVVHDIACCRKERRWQDVHRMFYFACRRAGVPELRSKIMFAAVYHFGPRWPEATPSTLVHPIEFEQLREFIENHNPPLELIEQYAIVRSRSLDCFKPVKPCSE